MDIDGLEEIVYMIYVAKTLYDMGKYDLAEKSFDDELIYEFFIDSDTSIVVGVELENVLSYDFLISDNYFIFYVTEVRQYFCKDSEKEIKEYIVNGWDVLYPIRRNSLINLTKRHILKSDLYIEH